MSKIKAKRVKKLQKELDYWHSELEYVKEILEEYHIEFEVYHRQYCAERDIDLAGLNKQSSKKVDQMLNKPVKIDNGVLSQSGRKYKDVFNRIYKKMAKKLHPDIGGDEEVFKQVTSAMGEKDIKKLLDICQEHDIIIDISDDLIKLLKEQIDETKDLINKEKSTYSWSLYSCEENEKCKQNVVKKFLKHLFNYEE